MLLATLCWVSCDGLASHPEGVVILLVTLCWVSCDVPASHPRGSSDAPNRFILRKPELKYEPYAPPYGSFNPVNLTQDLNLTSKDLRSLGVSGRV